MDGVHWNFGVCLSMCKWFLLFEKVEKKGYQVPADKRVYEGLESLPKRDDFLEISCYEMDYFWADSREWQETKRILENGVDITSWGIPWGDLQEKVAAMLDITDFGQLKEAFHSTDGPAVVYVRLEGEKVIVELQNLYPVADKIVISE